MIEYQFESIVKLEFDVWSASEFEELDDEDFIEQLAEEFYGRFECGGWWL